MPEYQEKNDEKNLGFIGTAPRSKVAEKTSPAL